MGSMLKFDSDRRELVRERRQARMERKAQRREDRGRKRTEATPVPTASASSTLSATQRAADERVRDDVDRIVEQALDRHDQRATTVGSTVAPTAPTAPITPDIAARRPAPRARPVRVIATSPGTPATRSLDADEQLTVDGGAEDRERRVSRRERDLAAFRERRQHAADAAREEARARIARSRGAGQCRGRARRARAPRRRAVDGGARAARTGAGDRAILRGRRAGASGVVGDRARRRSHLAPGAA